MFFEILVTSSLSVNMALPAVRSVVRTQSVGESAPRRRGFSAAAGFWRRCWPCCWSARCDLVQRSSSDVERKLQRRNQPSQAPSSSVIDWVWGLGRSVGGPVAARDRGCSWPVALAAWGWCCGGANKAKNSPALGSGEDRCQLSRGSSRNVCSAFPKSGCGLPWIRFLVILLCEGHCKRSLNSGGNRESGNLMLQLIGSSLSMAKT